MVKTFWIASALACALGVWGCHHDHEHGAGSGHTTAYASCNAITDACDAVDFGEGEVNRCHQLAHDAKSDAPCAAEKDACIAACSSSGDGGAPSSTDAGSD